MDRTIAHRDHCISVVFVSQHKEIYVQKSGVTKFDTVDAGAAAAVGVSSSVTVHVR